MVYLLAYFLGSIPTAKIIANMRGVDIRKVGSGNIGFTNAVRAIGYKWAMPVLIVDLFKGFIPVYIAINLLGLSHLQVSIVMVLAVIGHVFPVWLRFRGGKGIATSLGSAVALNLYFGIVAGVVYMLSRLLVKEPAVASLTAVWAVAIFTLATASPYYGVMIVISIFVTWTHRSNIKHMVRGTHYGAE